MKKTYITFIIILCSVFANAQINYASSNLDINNVSARFNAGGNHFWDGYSQNHFQVPSGGLASSIFTQTLWIMGADVNGQLKLAADKYSTNGKDFWPGPVSNVYDNAYDSTWNKVWKINLSQINAHIDWIQNPSAYPNYQIPGEILSWPAHGDPSKGQSYNLAPYFDYDGDGIYSPQYGDYPFIKGDQAIWTIINDIRHIHSETNGSNLGIEIGLMAYAYDCNSCVNNTIYMEYTITNRSTFRIIDAVIGIYTDFDLGFTSDDYLASDVSRGAYYVYNGNAVDGSGLANHYGTMPPAQGVVVLKGAKEDADGIDNSRLDVNGQIIVNDGINGFGYDDGIIDNEHSGLYGFLALNNTGTQPQTNSDAEYYNPLNLHINDSSPLLYGGNGTTATGATGPLCRFMYPGLSDPHDWGTYGVPAPSQSNWTETSVGNAPNDRNGLGLLKPCTFEIDGQHVIEIALVWARDTGLSINALTSAIDSVRYYYHNQIRPCNSGSVLSTSSTYELNQEADFDIYPNPVSDRLNIQLDILTIANYQVFDISGKLVKEGQFEQGNLHKVSTNQLQEGIYFIKIQSDSYVYTKKFIHHNN